MHSAVVGGNNSRIFALEMLPPQKLNISPFSKNPPEKSSKLSFNGHSKTACGTHYQEAIFSKFRPSTIARQRGPKKKTHSQFVCRRLISHSNFNYWHHYDFAIFIWISTVILSCVSKSINVIYFSAICSAYFHIVFACGHSRFALNLLSRVRILCRGKFSAAETHCPNSILRCFKCFSSSFKIQYKYETRNGKISQRVSLAFIEIIDQNICETWLTK